MPNLFNTKSAILAALLAAGMTLPAFSQQEQTEDGPRRTTEPVFRVSKRIEAAKSPSVTPNGAEANKSIANTPHPLDRALEIATDGLAHIRKDIMDYTAVMVKRERVKNQLGHREYMQVKIRNEREVNGKSVPFSIYMKFLKPRSTAGREVIWVKGENDNKLIAHEGGVLNVKRFYLEPNGWLAMKDNRYPIYEAGIENLVVKLIEKATRDRSAGTCEVNYRTGATINKRSCSVIEVIHNERKSPYDFHKAQVFIDDEYQIPIRYAAYDWPTAVGEAPPLMEEYTYLQVKLNTGLTDNDFSPDNPNYNYPKR